MSTVKDPETGERVEVPGAPCTWTQDDDESDTWDTSCGGAFTLIDDTPENNGFKFCCYCGKKVEQVVFVYDAEEASDGI